MINPATTTVFILAAGRGERMMPLTADTPKPLLTIGGHTLIEHHLVRLADAGFKHIVINVAYLGELIMNKLGNGHNLGLDIRYSDERSSGALETAGGIRQALPLIDSEQFLCLNADIWTDFQFTDLLEHYVQYEQLASIVLIPNPEHNRTGDFFIDPANNRVISKHSQPSLTPSYTFSGIGMYTKALFAHLPQGKQPLAPLLNQWCTDQTLTGRIYSGEWRDIGTPERLKEIREQYASSKAC